PGGPHYVHALLSDPGGPSALGHYCASVLSSTNVTVSTPAISPISRLNPTACTLAVYASQGHCSTATQDSLPDGRPAFPGRVESLPGPFERFQATALIPSSFPKLSWRTTKLGTLADGNDECEH